MGVRTFIPPPGFQLEWQATPAEIAFAINWAADPEFGDADILNNSWGYRQRDPATIPDSGLITQAILDAITNGRDGLGCIVVFSSGNDNGNVSFPASVNGVITVGAIDRNGNLSGYSNTGPEMDLVAPSSGNSADLVTTDREGDFGYNAGANPNYTFSFGGTSAACPQVSGVAALMLSIRPELTEQQVRTILQNTATDMGAGGFDNNFGFGRLNAQAAVQEVIQTIDGPTQICYNLTRTYSIDSNTPEININWTVSNNLTIESGQGTNTITVRSSSVDAAAWVEAELIGDCNSQSFRHSLWIGNPTTPIITGLENGITLGQTASIQIENDPNNCAEIISTYSDVGIEFQYVALTYAVVATNSAAYAGQLAWVYIGTYSNINPYIEFNVNAPPTANPPPDVNRISISRVPNYYPYPPVNTWKKVVASYIGGSGEIDYWEWSLDNSYYGHPDGITNTIFLPPDSNNITVRVRACSNTDGCSAYKTQVIN